MSNAALTWAFNSALENSGAKFVLVALADHATDHAGEDWTCFPSNERLSAFTGIPLRTLERHMSWLAAEGWITRSAERDRRGRLKDRTYALHREAATREALKADRAKGCADSADDCPPANMAGGEMAGPPAKTGADHPPKTASPPANMAGGHNIAEPPIEPSREPSPGVCVRERALFDEVAGLWAKTDPDRVARPRDWPAWGRAAGRCEGGVEALAGAARRYLAESGEVKRGHCRPFERWLNDDRWEGWLGEAAAGAPGAPVATLPGCDLPAEIWALVVGWMGVDTARTWLAGATWREADRTIVCRTGTAATWLQNNHRRDLLGAKISVATAVKGSAAA